MKNTFFIYTDVVCKKTFNQTVRDIWKQICLFLFKFWCLKIKKTFNQNSAGHGEKRQHSGVVGTEGSQGCEAVEQVRQRFQGQIPATWN